MKSNPSSIQTALHRSREQMSSWGAWLFSGVLQWSSSAARNSSSDCAVVVKWQQFRAQSQTLKEPSVVCDPARTESLLTNT